VPSDRSGAAQRSGAILIATRRLKDELFAYDEIVPSASIRLKIILIKPLPIGPRSHGPLGGCDGERGHLRQ
jgi:hypothetical protein